MVMDMMAGGPPPGAAAPPAGGPDLAAALGLGAAPPPPTQGVDNPAGGSELDALDAILQAIDAYMAIPTVDEGERLKAEKMSTLAQELKAQNQKMSDQLSGANPALRKALGPSG
jgi:hypothetical protein